MIFYSHLVSPSATTACSDFHFMCLIFISLLRCIWRILITFSIIYKFFLYSLSPCLFVCPPMITSEHHSINIKQHKKYFTLLLCHFLSQFIKNSFFMFSLAHSTAFFHQTTAAATATAPLMKAYTFHLEKLRFQSINSMQIYIFQCIRKNNFLQHYDFVCFNLADLSAICMLLR